MTETSDFIKFSGYILGYLIKNVVLDWNVHLFNTRTSNILRFTNSVECKRKEIRWCWYSQWNWYGQSRPNDNKCDPERKTEHEGQRNALIDCFDNGYHRQVCLDSIFHLAFSILNVHTSMAIDWIFKKTNPIFPFIHLLLFELFDNTRISFKSPLL